MIDVLLAAYDGEKWLPEQLSSLAGQTGEAFCVLMQDDGSTDGTAALLASQAAQDPRFRVVSDDSEKRLHGPIGNFWSLLAQSDAPYAALCDQDDVWDPGKLHCLREAMRTAELRWGADTPLLVHTDARVTAEDGHVLFPSLRRHQGWDPDATDLRRLLVQNNVTGCTLMMNAALKKLALSHGDPAQMHMHDWFLALTAAAFGRVIYVDVPLMSYRQHGTNAMGASEKGLAERGVKALSARQKGKARIALTFTHTKAFRDAYRGVLSGEAERVVEKYLALEHKRKPARALGILRGGYRMQSFVTRAGQLFFC